VIDDELAVFDLDAHAFAGIETGMLEPTAGELDPTIGQAPVHGRRVDRVLSSRIQRGLLWVPAAAGVGQEITGFTA
jgi:hypothetical protein